MKKRDNWEAFQHVNVTGKPPGRKTNMSDDNSGIKIEKFSGDKLDWVIWSEMYKSRAVAKELIEVFEMDPEDIPKEGTTGLSADKKKRIKKNVKAYSNLMLCIDMKKPAG